jgi:hypothetical protein
MKAHSACYWLIGQNVRSQPLGVAIDIHGEDGSKIEPTYTKVLLSEWDAGEIACIYAAKFDVPAERVFYDPDSTQAFANR